MNLFILDYDHDKNAEYHIDKHVLKMQLEATQLLSTALWVDKYIGYVPRKLTAEELALLQGYKYNEPDIELRTFTRYLPCHHNHPCSVWVRSSLENFYWTCCYVNALNAEAQIRGYSEHSSCIECNRLPEPINMRDVGLTPFAQAMPDAYKNADAVQAYRTYYRKDKADIATWKTKQPEWWNAQ